MNYKTATQKPKKYKDTKTTSDLNLLGEPLIYKRDPLAHIEKQLKNLELDFEEQPKSLEEDIVDTLFSFSNMSKRELTDAVKFINSGEKLPETVLSEEKRSQLLTIFSNLI